MKIESQYLASIDDLPILTQEGSMRTWDSLEKFLLGYSDHDHHIEDIQQVQLRRHNQVLAIWFTVLIYFCRLRISQAAFISTSTTSQCLVS